METKMTCMNCRRGCALEVSFEGNKLISVTGNACARGKDFAKREISETKASFLSEIRLIGSKDFLPVKTEKPIPKEKFSEAEAFCKGFRVPIPIRIGDVLVNDFCQTGIRLIALKSIR